MMPSTKSRASTLRRCDLYVAVESTDSAAGCRGESRECDNSSGLSTAPDGAIHRKKTRLKKVSNCCTATRTNSYQQFIIIYYYSLFFIRVLSRAALARGRDAADAAERARRGPAPPRPGASQLCAGSRPSHPQPLSRSRHRARRAIHLSWPGPAGGLCHAQSGRAWPRCARLCPPA